MAQIEQLPVKLLAGNGEAREAAWLKGVARVPLGCRARLDRGASVIEEFEWLGRRETCSHELSVDQATEALRSAILAAVRRATDGCRRIAVLSGGGVDSSALLGAAVHLWRSEGGPEVIPIALDFAGPGDDRPHLRELERALRIEAVRVSLSAGARFVRPGLLLEGCPMTWPTVGWTLEMLSVARSLGAERVVSGVGGDELFDGNLGAPEHRFSSGDGLAAISAARRTAPASNWRAPLAGMALRAVRDFVPTSVYAHRYARSLLRLAPWAGRRTRDVVLDSALGAKVAFAYKSERLRVLEIARGTVREAIAEGGAMEDRFSQINRVYPFFDLDIVALVASLPSPFQFCGDRRRGLLRGAMKGLVPDSVRLRRSKAGFVGAAAEIVRAAGGLDAFADLGTVELLEREELVDGDIFRREFERHRHSGLRDGLPLRLWIALSLENFLRHCRSNTLG